MKADIAKQWVEELKSGKWIQHQGCLGGGDSYRCCLGVLREMAPLGHKEPLDECMPSREVLGWAELDDGHAQMLAELNDEDGSGKYAGPIKYIEDNFSKTTSIEWRV